MIDKDTKIKIEGIPEGYTEISNSPKTATFYPKDQWNKKDFQYSVNAPSIGMKSELIDGQWYWVCGCPDCAGVEKNFHTRYFICDDHNVCVSCKTKSKDLPEGVTRWGTSTGFRCSTCQDRINYNQKIEALEIFESEEHDNYDFLSENEIKCPHCGTLQSSDDRHESEKEIECETCNGLFDLEVEYSASYSTSINGDRVTLKSALKEKKA